MPQAVAGIAGVRIAGVFPLGSQQQPLSGHACPCGAGDAADAVPRPRPSCRPRTVPASWCRAESGASGLRVTSPGDVPAGWMVSAACLPGLLQQGIARPPAASCTQPSCRASRGTSAVRMRAGDAQPSAEPAAEGGVFGGFRPQPMGPLSPHMQLPVALGSQAEPDGKAAARIMPPETASNQVSPLNIFRLDDKRPTSSTRASKWSACSSGTDLPEGIPFSWDPEFFPGHP